MERNPWLFPDCVCCSLNSANLHSQVSSSLCMPFVCSFLPYCQHITQFKKHFERRSVKRFDLVQDTPKGPTVLDGFRPPQNIAGSFNITVPPALKQNVTASSVRDHPFTVTFVLKGNYPFSLTAKAKVVTEPSPSKGHPRIFLQENRLSSGQENNKT